MLKKFTFWFICFGVSFWVSDVLGWTEQGKAFFYINLGTGILAITVNLVIAGLASGNTAETNKISFRGVFAMAVALAIILLTTVGATKLFGIDFFVAYQLMTFGQCLDTDSKKKDN